MTINRKATAKVQGYIPRDLKERMERVAKKAPYYSISVQTYMALEARMGIMEDRVGIRK
jgi:hypothetical protein